MKKKRFNKVIIIIIVKWKMIDKIWKYRIIWKAQIKYKMLNNKYKTIFFIKKFILYIIILYICRDISIISYIFIKKKYILQYLLYWVMLSQLIQYIYMLTIIFISSPFSFLKLWI